MKRDPFEVHGRKHAEKFIKRLEEENRKYFSLKEIIDEMHEKGSMREVFALYVAAHVIKKMGGKFKFRFFDEL